MKPYRFIISGGGTGGHIYPAIAIADALKLRYPNAAFLFVGARDRMEMEKVPQAGYSIKGLWISGFQRRLSGKNLLFPFKLASSLLLSRNILKAFKPDVAIGTGGYASAPLLRIAASRKIPCLIQEQNSHSGITNKWLGGKVDKICVAYEGMQRFFPSEKIIITGNPVRKDLLGINSKRAEALAFFKLKSHQTTLLVLGGSLGARRINELIEKSLPLFAEKQVQLIWQCGKYYEETYKNMGNDLVQVHTFLDRIDLAYAAADIIISRAGALSVSELCLVGKPVIFIPSPNVAEDHQSKNAQAIADKEAALVIKESELESSFESMFLELLTSPERQRMLSENIKKLARPRATEDIVEAIEGLLKTTPH